MTITTDEIDEAIRLLQKDIDNPGSVDILDVNKAEELGIEALNLIRLNRELWGNLEAWQLPSETKD